MCEVLRLKIPAVNKITKQNLKVAAKNLNNIAIASGASIKNCKNLCKIL